MADDRYVLFLDVLGFSELVRGNTPAQLKQIYDTEFQKAAANSTLFSASIFGRNINFGVIATPDRAVHDIVQGGLNFHVMSDTLIAWTNDDTADSFINLSQFTATYLAITLMLGLPHRGVISTGNIQLIELPLNGRIQSNVVGTGVVNAHRLESGQEWMGCVIDSTCLDRIEPALRMKCPIVSYEIPYKERSTLGHAINWPLCFRYIKPDAECKNISERFGAHGKTLIHAEAKARNTEAFFMATGQG